MANVFADFDMVGFWEPSEYALKEYVGAPLTVPERRYPPQDESRHQRADFLVPRPHRHHRHLLHRRRQVMFVGWNYREPFLGGGVGLPAHRCLFR